MGLKAMVETGFPVTPAGGGTVWIHDFDLLDEQGEHLVFEQVKQAFEEAFTAVWQGRTENDGFNRLVLELPASWREAALIRALSRHRQQSGLDPSQRVQEAALAAHPAVTSRILQLFRTKFDPALKMDLKARQTKAAAEMAEIIEALQTVESLDEDRVLRRIALLVGAIQRTNYYQPGLDGGPKPYISFKVASPELADLPLPKPYREIFVWATHVEGVHLRFGPVARGGLRMVRPSRRFPHRGPGPGEGPAGQERRHRAGGIQGRFLSQATAQGRQPRRRPGRGGAGLYDLPPGPAGHHRQPYGRGQGGPSQGRGRARRG